MLPALVFAWCGAAAFALSLLFFLYSFLVRFGAAIEDGGALRATFVNVALFAAFALHHSLLARPALKARVQQHLPPALERSVYTWIASLLFIGVCAWWQPVEGELYRATGPAAAAGYTVQLLGVLLTARSSARLDVLDLAGVRPVLRARQGQPPPRGGLETGGLYGFVRHPVYFAWVLLVFGTPHMTMTRFVFAVVSTAYLAVAIPLEERSLVRAFGAEYRRYQQRVRWRMIPGLY
jgi:protein-S-isoprenylcysteine O-methyltransferase Ste14